MKGKSTFARIGRTLFIILIVAAALAIALPYALPSLLSANADQAPSRAEECTLYFLDQQALTENRPFSVWCPTVGQIQLPLPAEPVIEPTEVLAESVEEPASRLSPHFPAEVRQWEELIVAAAQEFGIDPNLYAALIKRESWTYNLELCPDGPVSPSCTSRSGALGIAQVMPFHFGPQEDGRDPRTNIFRGAEVLAEALTIKNGDVRTALAAYNAGPYWETYPAESWEFADQILEWYREATAP